MRILFITSTSIGDAILSSGLLAHLIERHPGCEVTIACGRPAAPLFAEVPGLARIITMRKRRASLHWLGLWWRCAGTRWDLVVNLRRAPIMWLTRARAHRMLPAPDDSVHRIILIGRTLGLDPPPPRLWLAPGHEAAAARLVGTGPVIAVAPTANWGGKMWPAERFAALVRRLTGPTGILPGARVLVTGGGDEASMAGPLLESIPDNRLIDAFGLDLLSTYAAFKRCALFVGNDSGCMHLAAAAGVPTLGLFGPSPDRLYAPWGEKAAAVRTVEPFEALAADPRYDPFRQDTLMGGLTVDAAAAAAEDLWRRVGRRAVA